MPTRALGRTKPSAIVVVVTALLVADAAIRLLRTAAFRGRDGRPVVSSRPIPSARIRKCMLQAVYGPPDAFVLSSPESARCSLGRSSLATSQGSQREGGGTSAACAWVVRHTHPPCRRAKAVADGNRALGSSSVQGSQQLSQPLRFSRYGVGDMRQQSYTCRAHGHGIANVVVRFPRTSGSRFRRGSRSVRVRH